MDVAAQGAVQQTYEDQLLDWAKENMTIPDASKLTTAITEARRASTDIRGLVVNQIMGRGFVTVAGKYTTAAQLQASIHSTYGTAPKTRVDNLVKAEDGTAEIMDLDLGKPDVGPRSLVVFLVLYVILSNPGSKLSDEDKKYLQRVMVRARTVAIAYLNAQTNVSA